MFSSIIISGALAQDHEFIYPYYRLLEEKFNVDVALLGGKEVVGILGTKIPPNKDQKIILYCARGGRAGQAKEILSKLGYTNLENGGGILDVSKRLNLPIVKK